MTPGPGISRTQLPKGFFASGVNCGVRRYRPDLGMIFSETDCAADAVYTLNEMKAAPIYYCKSVLPSSKVRAVVTNSGQANAATGEEGMKRNQQMVDAVAKTLSCATSQVVSASTGVIGVQMDCEKIIPAIPEMLNRAQDSAESFALAILTTDLVPKSVTTEVTLSTGKIRITGICKGSGMIHPNMGTMLGYILTDAGMSVSQVTECLKESVNLSFNMISVDGDTSTNDCVFLLANGASGVSVSNADDLKLMKQTINQVSIFLAKSIARDGEGATKLVEVNVVGSPEKEMAVRASRGLTLSPLLKCAIHGEDPNWGRILARLGAERVSRECLEKMTVKLQGTVVFENGAPKAFEKEALRALLRRDTVVIDVELFNGSFDATAWGCDLSKKYVEINTDYS